MNQQGSDPVQQSFGSDRTPFEVLGGPKAVVKLAEKFYDTMDANPEYSRVRSLHQSDLTEAREKFAMFLSGWLGGPPLYVDRYGHPRLRMRHAPFPIGDLERDQWLACMSESLDACSIEGELRIFLDARFAHVADFMRNRS